MDATRTPHGDCNSAALLAISFAILDATRTPHGDCNFSAAVIPNVLIFDATRTPHGDCNRMQPQDVVFPLEMQPAPLTGTATIFRNLYYAAFCDATRTPHGDCNYIAAFDCGCFILMTQPAPLTGTILHKQEWRATDVARHLFTHFSLCFDHTCLLAAYSIHIILPLSDPTGRVWLVSTLLSQVCPLQSAVPAGYSATDTRIG